MARIVKMTERILANFSASGNHTTGIASGMFGFFKKKKTDFDTAMDFLQSSRVLMNTAMEARRHIDEIGSMDYASLVEVAVVVTESAYFLNVNLKTSRMMFNRWKAELRRVDESRYRNVYRIIQTIKGNFETAAANTVSINNWLKRDEAMNQLLQGRVLIDERSGGIRHSEIES